MDNPGFSVGQGLQVREIVREIVGEKEKDQPTNQPSSNLAGAGAGMSASERVTPARDAAGASEPGGARDAMPAHGHEALEPDSLEARFAAVCLAGGFVAKTKEKEAAEKELVASWLDGWEGVDFERDVLAVVRAVLKTRTGTTSSLQRFNAAIVDRRARHRAEWVPTATFDHSGEGQRAVDLRQAIGKVLPARAVHDCFGPTRLRVDGGQAVFVAGSAFKAEELHREFAHLIAGPARGVGVERIKFVAEGSGAC